MVEKTLILIGKSFDETNLNIIIKNTKERITTISLHKIENLDIDFYIDNVTNDLNQLLLKLKFKNIITIGDLHLDNKFHQFLYNKYNIHCFSLDGLNNFEKVNEFEYLNIINFKLFIFLSVLNNDNYCISGLVRYLIKLHDNYENTKLFIKNGLKIITYKNLNKHLNLKKEIIEDETELITNIKLLPSNNKIFLGFHPWGLEQIFGNKLNINNKVIMWQDDLHWFANNCEDSKDNYRDVTKYDKKYNPLFLDSLDALVTPSPIYFKNLNITEYDHKIKFLFYILNPDHYNKLYINNYKNRKNQIILSGVVGGGYKTRIEFNNLKNKFRDLIFHQESPGYKNNEHMTEMNYYNKVSEYKGAFVGHHLFPINFLLAKHIEVLMCGCIGFFENHPLLKEELGLIEYEHYIPCSDDNGNLIEDENFYYDWLEKGEEIAKKGSEYVRNKFGKNYIKDYINILLNV